MVLSQQPNFYTKKDNQLYRHHDTIFLISGTRHGKPRPTLHYIVLLPGEFNDVIPVVLPMYPDSFILIAVIVNLFTCNIATLQSYKHIQTKITPRCLLHGDYNIHNYSVAPWLYHLCLH